VLRDVSAAEHADHRAAGALAGSWADRSVTVVAPAPAGSSTISKSVDAAKRGAGLPARRSASWHQARRRGGSHAVMRWSTSLGLEPQWPC
jgi:hypothetical protein